MIKKVFKVLGLIMLPILTTVIGAVVILYTAMGMFCDGRSPAAKQVFTTTVLETGSFKFLASVYLTPEEIQAVVNSNSMEEFNDAVDTSLITVSATSNKSSGKVSQTTTGELNEEGVVEEIVEEKDIEIIEIAGRTFHATMLKIKDPSRVTMATIYPWRKKGETLDKLVKNNEALAGVNAGLYASSGNTGGRPIGVVVSNGEILMNEPWAAKGLVLIGLTEDNILIIQDVSSMSAKESKAFIEENKIRDACCFQEEKSDKNNHFVQLIINGEQREMNGMGSGLNPRTAIGQCADGALLLLVTDGRGAKGHLGASASDLISVMAEYGAVNAANMDGGSSSCMYYDGEYLMDSVTFYYTNSSWYLPFAWIVK